MLSLPPRGRVVWTALGLAMAVLATAVLALGAPRPAHADAAPGAGEAPLGIFSPKERAQLAPLLARGPVALVEFGDDETLPAIVFAVNVEAPAERVLEVLRHPEEFPKFMPALDSVTVRARHEVMTAYEWTWKTSLVTLTGSSVMNVFVPPPGREAHGYRVSVRNTSGDLGEGRMLWRVYPMGRDRCLLVFSSRLDLRNANWMTRQIEKGGRSVNRTANIALAFAMLAGVERRAEGRRREKGRNAAEAPPLARPPVEPRKLARLLDRGDLILLDMDGDRLTQVSAVGRMFARHTKLKKVLADPEAFGGALVPGSYVRVTGHEGARTDFEWGIDLPLIGTSGRMRMEAGGDESVRIDALSGGIEGGSWRLEPVKLPWKEGALISYGRFEPEKASWLIRALVSGNRDIGHGIVIGSQVMLTRAVRSRVN